MSSLIIILLEFLWNCIVFYQVGGLALQVLKIFPEVLSQFSNAN